MLKELKEQVWQANLSLMKYGLVILTFGNASGIDRSRGLVVIKPSGVAYDAMRPRDMVVVDLAGKVIEGELRPSSDTPTHLALYRSVERIGGVAHTHSEYATMFAQANREIPCLGTTHADCFNGPVPVTRFLNEKEVTEDYEANTGKIMLERCGRNDPMQIPAVLVAGHGPFAWGVSALDATKNIFLLENVARIAWGTLCLSSHAADLPSHILKKHFNRKHGADAYYGQKEKE